MNIGKIVSTVQSEPLEEALGEDFWDNVITDTPEPAWSMLVNDEITPEIKEDIFA
jgi:hypothetical protein